MPKTIIDTLSRSSDIPAMAKSQPKPNDKTIHNNSCKRR